jgi:3'-phosphoadenosine 5'-phosphosulfate sulfotransferase (PAPS reductase)/FAD synthetase
MKIIILYSGGKDSQAAMIWAVERYGVENCEAVFCDTQWENPVTLEHIRETTKQIGIKLITLHSEGMVELAARKKRFPSTMARFCTESLKVHPTFDYVLSHREHLIVIEGIRKNESHARSKMQAECTFFKYYFEPYRTDKQGKPLYFSYRKKEAIEWCKSYNADKIRPIFEWTAQQTIDHILQNGQQPNLLYYNGFKRVGCFPCIMANHSEVKLISQNHPEMWERLENAESKVNSSFFPPDYIPKHACSNRKYPTVQDVKRYLENKNSTLDMFQETTPGCMSAYNLCE